jgi:hypothetical protein
VNQPEVKRHTLALVLRAALLVALAWAGWRIYQRLPAEEGGARGASTAQPTTLHIIVRRADDAALAGLEVHLYSVDVAAVQREFISERRPGVRFDDFLARRMQGRAPVAARLDETGQATVTLMPGRWWIHATLAGTEEIVWRLPVNIAGREQTVELSPDNAYMRAKSF